eukprot:COSAG04_NODE_14912_length_550_cov_0.895787_1_plen_68_part_01
MVTEWLNGDGSVQIDVINKLMEWVNRDESLAVYTADVPLTDADVVRIRRRGRRHPGRHPGVQEKGAAE